MEEPLRGYFTKSKIEKVAAVLRDGGVAVLPTDTIYGLHCVASNIDAVRRIARLKGRGGHGGFILLAADIDMAGHLVGRWPHGARDLLEQIWPAPLTAILPASKDIDSTLITSGTIAVRIPSLTALRRCIERVGFPIVSTSANRSGQEPLTRIGEIERDMPDLDAYISQRGRPASKSSTIVDMTTEQPRLVRPGRHLWPIR